MNMNKSLKILSMALSLILKVDLIAAPYQIDIMNGTNVPLDIRVVYSNCSDPLLKYATIRLNKGEVMPTYELVKPGCILSHLETRYNNKTVRAPSKGGKYSGFLIEYDYTKGRLEYDDKADSIKDYSDIIITSFDNPSALFTSMNQAHEKRAVQDRKNCTTSCDKVYEGAPCVNQCLKWR